MLVKSLKWHFLYPKLKKKSSAQGRKLVNHLNRIYFRCMLSDSEEKDILEFMKDSILPFSALYKRLFSEPDNSFYNEFYQYNVDDGKLITSYEQLIKKKLHVEKI